MELEFAQFSDGKLAATRTSWLEDAEAGWAFGAEIERLMDWIGTHRKPTDGDSVAYGVFPKGKNVAVGVCEMTIQRKTIRSKWIKLLRLHLRPKIEDELVQGDATVTIDVFAAAITGSLALQVEHTAHTLKIYGRTNEQLRFLQAFVRHLDGRFENVKVAIEGRFLTLRVI